MPIKRFLSALAIAGFLAGCTSDIDTLRTTQGTGSPFTKALTDEYRLLSVADADDYDWPDARHFARKGLSAASGQVVLPEEPDAWHLPPDKVEEISKGRIALMQRLDDGFRDFDPEIAARGQARFDCLSPALENYILYFDFDKSELNSQGRLVIDQVIADARKMREGDAWPNVSVTGHTDLAGSASYNLKLSLRRTDAVRAALIQAGIPAANIMTAGRGESDPAVPSPDGVAEAKDRRVVIVLL